MHNVGSPADLDLYGFAGGWPAWSCRAGSGGGAKVPSSVTIALQNEKVSFFMCPRCHARRGRPSLVFICSAAGGSITNLTRSGRVSLLRMPCLSAGHSPSAFPLVSGVAASSRPRPPTLRFAFREAFFLFKPHSYTFAHPFAICLPSGRNHTIQVRRTEQCIIKNA